MTAESMFERLWQERHHPVAGPLVRLKLRAIIRLARRDTSLLRSDAELTASVDTAMRLSESHP